MSPRTAAAPLSADLEAGLKRLKLSTIRRQAPEVLLTAKTQRWAPEETLRVLIDMEIASRDESNCRARMAAARFPVHKTLAQFDLAESSIPTASHDYLVTLDWIGRADNLCLVGPAGTGKSHYLIALGRAAVEARHKVRYFTAVELVEHLWRAVADNTVGRSHRNGVPQRSHRDRRDRLRPARPHRLPADVPADRRCLRTTLGGYRLPQPVRSMGTVPARPAHRRLPSRPTLPPRPHRHHHRRQLPAHPPHHKRRGLMSHRRHRQQRVKPLT